MTGARRVLADEDAAGQANAGVNREIHRRDAREVDVVITAAPARIAPEEAEGADGQAQQSAGRDPVVELGRAPGRAEGREVVRPARLVEGERGRLVHRDVVRVVVAADRIEGDHHLGPHLPDHRDHVPRDLVDRRGHEGPGMPVVGRPGHAGVAIAQVEDVGQAERGGRAAQLGPAALAELGLRGRIARLVAPRLAARGAGVDHPHAVDRVLGEGAAGAERLIVGVRAHEHQRAFDWHVGALGVTVSGRAW